MRESLFYTHFLGIFHFILRTKFNERSFEAYKIAHKMTDLNMLPGTNTRSSAKISTISKPNSRSSKVKFTENTSYNIEDELSSLTPSQIRKEALNAKRAKISQKMFPIFIVTIPTAMYIWFFYIVNCTCPNGFADTSTQSCLYYTKFGRMFSCLKDNSIDSFCNARKEMSCAHCYGNFSFVDGVCTECLCNLKSGWPSYNCTSGEYKCSECKSGYIKTTNPKIGTICQLKNKCHAIQDFIKDKSYNQYFGIAAFENFTPEGNGGNYEQRAFFISDKGMDKTDWKFCENVDFGLGNDDTKPWEVISQKTSNGTVCEVVCK